MQRGQMSPAGPQVVRDAASVKRGRVGAVAQVGINLKVGAVYGADVAHGLFHGVHERGFHRLEGQNDAQPGGVVHGSRQAGLEKANRFA
jgi:hypothetical protein